MLILGMCGAVWWISRNRGVHAFLISINPITGQWQILGHDHGMRTITASYSLQQSVLAHFANAWFTISSDPTKNEQMWAGLSKISDCASDEERAGRAGLYCMASSQLYKEFIKNVVPDYQRRVSMGETWSLDMDSLYITPAGDGTTNTWRIMATVMSNLSYPIQVMAYATVGHDTTNYPNTMGYYVTNFNAYKTN